MSASIFFMFWTFLASLNGSANPLDGCGQLYDMDLRLLACTQIIEQGGFSPKEVVAARTMRGIAYRLKGDIDRANADFDGAVTDLDSIIRRNSLDAEAFSLRGVAHRGRGHFKQAIADYDEAIRLDPRDMETFNSRCWARALLGTDLDIARADCDTALRLSNNAPNHLDSRGLVGLKQGKFAEAWTDYDMALQAVPGTADFLYGRGIAALRLGRAEEGNTDIREALRLNSNIARIFADHGMTP